MSIWWTLRGWGEIKIGFIYYVCDLLLSHWPHESKDVMLVAELGICSSCGH